MARHGQDLAIPEYPIWWAQHRETAQRQPGRAALVYVDRSIYRPGQAVLWKLVVYEPDPERETYSTERAATVTVFLENPNGQVIGKQKVTTNDFGSAAGRFEIPPGEQLGTWHVGTSLGGSTRIFVEEYRRPSFHVRLADPEKPLRLNRQAELRVEAGYLFGLPVEEGEVRWHVVREPDSSRWRSPWANIPTSRRETVAAGSGHMDALGRFIFQFLPTADGREASIPGITYSYRVVVEVTDASGETRKTHRVFRLGFTEVRVELVEPPGFLNQGTTLPPSTPTWWRP